MLNNKNILISGGTGSFGNLFVEKVLKKFKPNGRPCVVRRKKYYAFSESTA
jgi:FlaA1/EpsC-like NDP-sugar epimerase